jgi:hypothetical protein
MCLAARGTPVTMKGLAVNQSTKLKNSCRNIKNSLLHLLLFHQVIWNNLLRKFKRWQKSLLCPKENY